MGQAATRWGRATERDDDPLGWKEEAKCLMRALAGGAILGMPLLYTMEMWWHGMTLSPWHLLGLMAGILVINFLFSLLSGFREEYSPGEAAMEAVTSVGIGVLFSAVVLLLIGEIGPDIAVTQSLSKIVLESAPVSLGVSFANSQIAGRSRTGEEDGKEEQEPDDPERRQLKADLRDASAALAGATVFAFNIAPTEEIIQIASRLTPWHLLGMLAAALMLCYIILFASGFEQHQVHVDSPFQHPLAETVLTVALSLIVAFLLLIVIGQRDTLSHPQTAIAATLTLGLPAVVGGSAGRIIV